MTWTDDNKRQGRDGDVEQDLDTFDRVWLNAGLAIALCLFLGLVGWGLPAVAQWVRGWL